MNDLDSAILALKNDSVVGVPTETVYGLGARISSPKAIERVFSLKKRPFFDPLIVHIGSPQDIEDLVRSLPKLATDLAEHFWPGPLTLVLPKAKFINPMITSGLDSVGVRMPNHPLTLELINQLGEPLAAPSANLFTKLSPTTAEHVRAEFPDIEILDGGPCEVGIESTVIGFSGEELLIHRPGGVSEESLRKFMDENDWKHIRIRHIESSTSPGQIKHHYMPNIPLVLLNTNRDIQDAETRLIIEKDMKDFFKFPVEIKLPNEAPLAARALYSELRIKSASPATGLWFCPSPRQLESDWTAIWDRLNKAATLRV